MDSPPFPKKNPNSPMISTAVLSAPLTGSTGAEGPVRAAPSRALLVEARANHPVNAERLQLVKCGT